MIKCVSLIFICLFFICGCGDINKPTESNMRHITEFCINGVTYYKYNTSYTSLVVGYTPDGKIRACSK